MCLHFNMPVQLNPPVTTGFELLKVDKLTSLHQYKQGSSSFNVCLRNIPAMAFFPLLLCGAVKLVAHNLKIDPPMHSRD